VLGSILTRQYRFATRGVRITCQVAQQAFEVAGGVAGAVADRLGRSETHGGDEVIDGEVVSEPPVRRPAAKPTPPEETATAPGPTRIPRSPGAQRTRRAPVPPEAADAPVPAESPGTPEPPETSRVPEPPATQPVAETIAGAPASPISSEPVHVSEGAEIVEEVAEPGAEDGAGAQIRIDEPWEGYRHLKARDIVARLTSATREELAAVELYEVAHANRRSVVQAAQRALKQASPPR
jgi:hypothetical protein